MKIFVGEVIGTKMAKTAKVVVTHIVIHPVYKKRQKKTRKYQVHDELGTKVGDKVRFVATKPYSKLKRWKITEIITEEAKKKGVKKGK